MATKRIRSTKTLVLKQKQAARAREHHEKREKELAIARAAVADAKAKERFQVAVEVGKLYLEAGMDELLADYVQIRDEFTALWVLLKRHGSLRALFEGNDAAVFAQRLSGETPSISEETSPDDRDEEASFAVLTLNGRT